eukprot:2448564-Rhodomonas_salina.1
MGGGRKRGYYCPPIILLTPLPILLPCPTLCPLLAWGYAATDCCVLCHGMLGTGLGYAATDYCVLG